MFRALSLGLLSLALSACGTTYFSVQRLAPAEVNIPVGKAIAITDVAGEGGTLWAAELTQALLETQRFQILERQNIQAAVNELKFSSDGFVADESAISFGKMTGAGAILVGEVTKADYQEKVNKEVYECPKPAPEEGAPAEENPEPAPEVPPAECSRFTRAAGAELWVTLKVIETETGHVLAAKNLSARRQTATHGDTEPAEIGAKDTFFAECRAEMIAAFKRAVAPHMVEVKVALRSDDDLPELEVGNNYAKVGNWTAAVEQYRTALSRAQGAEFSPKQRSAARYNLGIGLGYSGAYDEGIAEIERAYAESSDELYRQQIGVIRQFKADAAKIAEQNAPSS